MILIYGIISLIVLIVFFVMASNVGKLVRQNEEIIRILRGDKGSSGLNVRDTPIPKDTSEIITMDDLRAFNESKNKK